MPRPHAKVRHMALILGDQLDHTAAVFDDFDPQVDVVWMAEVEQEATHVWCHQQRIALFFSAMRHFRDELIERGFQVRYHALTADRKRDRGADFATVLARDVGELRPAGLTVVWPGDHRVLGALQQEAARLDLPLQVRADRHFYCGVDEFREFAAGRKSLLLETFYRQLRKKHDILMQDGQPAGGAWNLDHENRRPFPRSGPSAAVRPRACRPDATTREVMELVAVRFGDHPGSLDHFHLPVTRAQARRMLRDFVQHGLPLFGTYEDAMWMDEPFLYHSRLSTSLNLKLLSPRECVEQAVAAYLAGQVPLNSAEGFVRQILGWREFVRGVYWLHMPRYQSLNYLGHDLPVPAFYWHGQTDMQCIHQSLQHVLRYGYAHHIHRLMVLGNLALLAGVHPRHFHDWHMAMYLDAVDWVSLPNTLGMSQYGDGGIVGTKPYVSTGNYINKMSNFCAGCPYDPQASTGPHACPFTTLYWDFLDRHFDRLRGNARMSLQIKHVAKKRESGEMTRIREEAARCLAKWYTRGPESRRE